jgi:hypothetical protein
VAADHRSGQTHLLRFSDRLRYHRLGLVEVPDLNPAHFSLGPSGPSATPLRAASVGRRLVFAMWPRELGRAMSLKPTLVVNPASDRVFADFTEMLVDHGVRSLEDLASRLRAVYPDATVHRRELTGEAQVVWYVYRDGHWVNSRSNTSQEAGRIDVRHAR